MINGSSKTGPFTIWTRPPKNLNDAHFVISVELLAEICKGLKEGEGVRAFEVVANGIPPDATVVGLAADPDTGVIRCDVVTSGAEGALPAPVLRVAELS